MTNFTMPLHNSRNEPITLTAEVGKGGEATVYHVTEYPDLVAKIYHQPTPAHEAKLRAMLANPPEQPTTHIAIAWPTELLYQSARGLRTPDADSALIQGEFVGFLMPKINQAEFSSIFDVYNPVRRRVRYPQATKQTLYQVAVALVKTVAAIHAKGHIIGDINESNILVRDEQISTQQNVFGRLWHWLTQGASSLPLITFVDADSFQIRAESGQVYRSLVAKPEYTPPELHGVQLKEVDRTIEHDNFGVAVLLFQLLMEGHHPFAGVLRGTESVGRVDLYSIRQGLFPYHATPDLTPPPHAPQFGDLAPDLQAAFVRCFVKGHHHPHLRPGAREWEVLLQQALAAFVTCSQGHVYSSHLNHCPQCDQLPQIPKVVGRVTRPLHSPGGQVQGGNDELAQPLAEVGAETVLKLSVFDNLAQVIDGAVAGAVIYLEAGEYRLTETLEIKKSVQLMGAGLDKTVIIGPEVGHVIKIQAVTFVAQGITFQATHEKSHVIFATDTNLTLTECRCCHGDVGIWLRGKSQGLIQQCVIEHNHSHGIWFSNQSTSTLIENVCRANKGAGILYWGWASGTAQQNQCVENEQDGIQVHGQASPILIENICRANKGAGILYGDKTSGTVQQNQCVENGGGGISVYNQAKPTLIENICRANKHAGIDYCHEAGGTAQQNQCVENLANGIALFNQARPCLIENICRANKWAGILYSQAASGTAQQNQCVENGRDGIHVYQQTSPSLIENICRANNRAGIFYDSEAGGIAQQNQCVENEQYGISVSQQAGPSLIENICRANKQAGIFYYHEAGGTARGNQCLGNGQDEIQVRDKAKPILEGNIIGAVVSAEVWPELPEVSHDSVSPGTAETSHQVVIELKVSDDLAQVVAQAADAATLYLQAREYRLTETLEIKKSIQLIGAGIDKTVIIGPEVGHVIKMRNVAFVAQGITFQARDEISNTVFAANTNLTLRECRCCLGKVGVLLHGTSYGIIQQCIIEHNRNHGIWLSDQTMMTLVKNMCRANKWSGIVYGENASGMAQQNQCEKNGDYGILVSDSASPNLLENICRGNKWAGIKYWGQAGGTAQQNQCVENEGYGILLSEQVSPNLLKNLCRGNKQGGIVYSLRASGIAQQNQCVENEQDGIQVNKRATPMLIENICRANRGAGIVYDDEARGTARGNQCLGNGQDEIQVRGEAKPILEDNIP